MTGSRLAWLVRLVVFLLALAGPWGARDAAAADPSSAATRLAWADADAGTAERPVAIRGTTAGTADGLRLPERVDTGRGAARELAPREAVGAPRPVRAAAGQRLGLRDAAHRRRRARVPATPPAAPGVPYLPTPPPVA